MTFRTFCRLPRLADLPRHTLPLVLAFGLLPAAVAAQTGSISGTVTNAAGGAPLAGLPVRASTLDGSVTVTVATDASGVYTVSGLTPGEYFVFTSAATGFVNEVYDNIQCPGFCPNTFITSGPPVVVPPGGTAPGVDFALDAGGSIAGRITNAADGAPLPNVSVSVYTRVGSTVFTAGSGLTNASGDYTTGPLASGTYFVATSGANNQGFINEILGNIPCVGSCSSTAAATGTPVAVTLGASTPGADFALDTGGRIAGVITDAATSTGIQNVFVNVYTVVNGSATFAGSAATNASGAYTVQGLPAGSYFAHTSNTIGYMNEIFDGLLCPLSCQSSTAVASGAPIPVTLGATTSGRNFALQLGGTISGTVTDGTNPLSGRQVIVVTRVGNTTYSTSAVTNASGLYTARGLPTGSYWAYTFGGGGLIDEIFDNIPCYGFCNSTDAMARGTPIPVTAGANTGGRDFALSPGGGISGTVTDAATGQPIAGRISVTLFAVVGTQLISAGNRESTSGGYSFGGLIPGNYIAYATSAGYIDELYDNIPCWRGFCNFSSGTLIPVAAGAVSSGRSFALTPGDLITGTVTDEATGSPLPGITVTFYQRVTGGGSAFAGSATTGPAGTYRVRGLPAGTYVAYTSSHAGYFGEIYNDIRCTASCSASTAVASGTAIAVSGTPLTAGIDFALDARNDAPAAPTNLRAVTDGFSVQFTWTAPSLTTGGAPTSYVLEAGISPGTTIVSIPVNGTSYLAAGVPPGTYYVRIRGVNAAGTGAPSNEVTLTVTASGSSPLEPPTNLVAFMSGGLLTLTWAAPATGGVPTGYIVEAGSATGLTNIASVPVSGRSFVFAPVPDGFYFVRVRAQNASSVGAASLELMLVVGNVATPPGAPNFTSAQVNGSTVTLNWAAPAFGSPTSYIIEAGSATGLSNLAVVNTGSTALSAGFSGVPSGTYYVRVRAVNALGASIASNERTLTVP